MATTFQKMHGLGNDFVLLDLRHQDFPVDRDMAVRLANRHTGIGCDQVLVLHHPLESRHLARFEIWNADGSQAEQCGNGMRCLGLYLQMRSEAPPGPFLLGGPAGEVAIECLDDGLVRVNMGKPDFDPAHIPVLLEPQEGWYTLGVEQNHYKVGAVSMGNPHALMLVDDVNRLDVARLGAAISCHAAFPEGCNAGFAHIIDRQNIHLRVFERGAAETQACGSGACAAMSILSKAGLVDKTIKVTQAGGNLILSWTKGDSSVIMTGAATHVFEGNLA